MHKTKWDSKNAVELKSSGSIVEQLLRARGMNKDETASFLNPDYNSGLGDPFLLPDMEKAVKRIKKAIDSKEVIIVYGDYDIDGLTASTLLVDALKQIGACVSAYIPDRFEEGYGLNSKALKAIQKNGAKLVITVDCGVTATKEIAEAKKNKLDIIVTDHHEAPAVLPKGQVALINPKLKSPKYPFVELAGVGVAFMLVRAIQKRYPGLLEEGKEKWLLDMVALGTVCDVVPLLGENRILVYYGLKVLQKSRRVGVQKLAEVSGVDLSKLDSSDLGFRLGPRLNAAGRLEHAKSALLLLQTNDMLVAREQAEKLQQLNVKRQEQTSAIFAQADIMAKHRKNDLILVLASSEWSHGVVGIVASRIAEKWHKPTLLLQIEGNKAKGSARSFGDFSIIEAINECGEHLINFGGHDFAAGVSLYAENIEIFRYAINQYGLQKLDVSSQVKRIDIGAIIGDDQLKIDVVHEISALQPYGRDNSEPLFLTSLLLDSFRFIGNDLTHVKFSFKTQNNTYIDGIAFSSAHKWPDLATNSQAEIVARLMINDYFENERLQLEVIDIRQ